MDAIRAKIKLRAETFPNMRIVPVVTLDKKEAMAAPMVPTTIVPRGSPSPD